MMRVAANSSSHSVSGRARGTGSVTLLVLVMLALASSPAMGKAAIAQPGTERTSETRVSVGGELAIRQQRQTRRDRAAQRVHPAAIVRPDRTARTALLVPQITFCLTTAPAAVAGRVREALLALPPPGC